MKVAGNPKTVFNDYKKVGLYIATPFCNFKCVKEAKEKGVEVTCHNGGLDYVSDMSAQDVVEKHLSINPFAECIILSGLDPIDNWVETKQFINDFRKITDMEIVLFTGYYPNEIMDKLVELEHHEDIMFKFGRFNPINKPRFDDLGGVKLSTGNQYFKSLKDALHNS